MPEVGVGTVAIRPDFGRGFRSSIDRQVNPAVSGMESKFKGAFGRIASAAGVALAGAAVVKGLSDAVGAARESIKIGKLTEQVIKTTGGAAKISAAQVGDLATQLSKKTGIDDELIQSGANLVLTFTNIRNEAGKGNAIFDRTVAVANDMSVALGQDMKSSSIQLGKALNDPIKGVSALSRVGVSFTAQQKDQIKTLVESGDVLGAQKVILAEVGKEFGGAAAAAATPMDKLKVVVGNLQERVGMALIPIIDKAATFLGDNLPKALDLAGRGFAWLGEKLAPVGRWFSNVFGEISGGIKAFAAAWKYNDGEITSSGFPGFMEKVGYIARTVFGEISGGIKGLVGWIRDNLSVALTVLGGLFFGLVGAVIVAYLKFESFRDLVNRVGAAIWAGLGAALTWITGTAIPAVVGAVRGMIEGFRTGGGGGFFGDLGVKARAVSDWIIGTAIPGIKQAIGSFIAGLKGQGGAGSFFTDLGNAARTFANWFVNTALPMIQRVFDQLRRLFGWLTTDGKPILIAIGIAFAALAFPVATAVAAFIYAYQRFSWFRTAVAAILGAIRAYFQNIWLPTFVFMWRTASTYFGYVKGYIDTVLIPVFRFLWGYLTTVVFPGIRLAITVAWSLIRPVFMLIAAFVRTVLIPAFGEFMDRGRVVWAAVHGAITGAWRIITPAFDAIVRFVREELVPRFEALMGTVKIVWANIHTAISGAWGIIKPVFDKVNAFVTGPLTSVWNTLSGAVSTAWNKIPGIIGGVLRTVGGLLSGFLNGAATIADKVGLGPLADGLRAAAAATGSWGQVSTASNRQTAFMARGGVVPVGPGFVTNGPQAIVGEGRLAHPEFVIPTDPRYRERARGLWEQAGVKLMAGGGVIGDGWDRLKGAAGNVAGKVADVAGGAFDWARKVVGGLLEQTLPGPWGVPDGLQGLPAGAANQIRAAAIGLIKGESAKVKAPVAQFTGGGGGGPPGAYTAKMQEVRAAILGRFGPMAVGGYANRTIAGTGVLSDHARYRAWDFMVGLGNVAKGNAISSYLLGRAGDIGLKYLIWNAMRNSGSGWQPYSHPGGGTSPTLMHRDHVHASFYKAGGILPSYAQGGFVPRDMVAQIHQGEYISTADEVTAGRTRGVVVENFHANGREDVDEFWRRAAFYDLAGAL